MKFTDVIELLDQELRSVIEEPGIVVKPYGLATRLIEFNGKSTMASSRVKNSQKPDEYDSTDVDDRYHVLWHHRLENAIPRRETNGAYGPQEFGVKYEYNIVSVFAIRSDYRDFLFEKISHILSKYTTLIDVNFETSVVFRQEYISDSDSDSFFPAFSFFSVRSYILVKDDSYFNECCG